MSLFRSQTATDRPALMTHQILLVEDERGIADAVIYNLEREGFDVVWERDGRDGLARAVSMLPDLVILDLMLPGIDGLQVCRQLKDGDRTRGIRVLMLTARSSETDEIVGFNLGADDYVTKPFRITPLIHRIKALLRRDTSAPASSVAISLHGIDIDQSEHVVRTDGEETEMTPTEFRLLWTLMSQPGRPFSRQQLMETARGEYANSLERTIDVHVRSLRKKLARHCDAIETIRGVGYRFKRR
jgi:two-component system, OmpR family, phosphate regulon response regulator PhoB